MRVKIRWPVGFFAPFPIFPLFILHFHLTGNTLYVYPAFSPYRHSGLSQLSPKSWMEKADKAGRASEAGDAGATCRTGNGHAHTGVRQHGIRSSEVG